MRKIVANNVNRAISAARQRIFDHALDALRAHRTNDDFAAELFSHAQRFFERVAVRLVDLKGKIALFNPGRVFVDSQDRVFVRDLLHQDDYFHCSLGYSCQSSVVSGQ